MTTEELRRKAREHYHEHGYLLRLQRVYGLGADAYLDMLERQGHVCAACRSRSIRQNGTTQRLHVDHDHETGRVRGLLCHNCNRAIGLVGDSPDRLEALAAYLRGNDGESQ